MGECGKVLLVMSVCGVFNDALVREVQQLLDMGASCDDWDGQETSELQTTPSACPSILYGAGV